MKIPRFTSGYFYKKRKMGNKNNSYIKREKLKEDISKKQKPKQYFKSYFIIFIICFAASVLFSGISLIADGESVQSAFGKIGYLYDLGISFIASAVIYTVMKAVCPNKMK